MATRRKILPLVLEIARASGAVVVFDDLHKPSYHEEVRRRLKELGCHPFDLSSYTSDDYGRYAWLADVGQIRIVALD